VTAHDASQYLPPEMLGEMGTEELSEASIQQLGPRDVATRYHEFKTQRAMRGHLARLKAISSSEILRRARKVVGSVVRPHETKRDPFSELPIGAIATELDFDSTIEDSHDIKTPETFWFEYQLDRPKSAVLCLDTSLSMTGEKMALSGVALGVLALQFPEDPLGVVVFENTAELIKSPSERMAPEKLIGRFLDTPARGYTDLEAALIKARAASRRAGRGAGSRRDAPCVLVTDGKYTAGSDPAYLAASFSTLIVIKVGMDKAGAGLCAELARNGSGFVKEIQTFDELPSAMYGVVKALLRGRGF
jgi:Mg-chelatase subunit ChlD